MSKPANVEQFEADIGEKLVTSFLHQWAEQNSDLTEAAVSIATPYGIASLSFQRF